MGKSRGSYKEEFGVGSLVKIAERDVLELFMQTGTLHNGLNPEQLAYAGEVGRVKSVSFYHGGDELYQIEGIPGLWHEQCLRTCTSPSCPTSF